MIDVDRSSRTSLRRLAVAGTLVAASVFGTGAAASAEPAPPPSAPSVATAASQFAVWDGQKWTGEVLLQTATQAQDVDINLPRNRAESGRNNMVNRHWCGVDDQLFGDSTVVRFATQQISTFGQYNNVVDWFYARRGACDD